MEVRRIVFNLCLFFMIVCQVFYLHIVVWRTTDEADQQSFLTVEKDDDDIKNFVQKRDSLYQKRSQMADSVCRNQTFVANRKLASEVTLKHDILWEHHYKVAFCGTPRAGLRWWQDKFVQLAHLPDWSSEIPDWMLVKRFFNFPNDLTRHQMLELLDGSFSFTFVRHPFVRLSAVFLDRVVMNDFNGWRSKIFQTNGFKEPSFQDFVQFVLDGGPDGSEHVDTCCHHCDVCRIDYDVIGKYETFEDDTRYIMYRSGLVQHFPDLDKHLRLFHNQLNVDLERSLELFETLHKQVIEQLYQHYQLDFLIFGYEIAEFYSRGKGLDE